ncbi:MAG: hypothetical protein JWN34_3505, partial [Bryobacterales bacterium]|nr:hypothetical protein [Bryobacterales bacterium]
EVDKASAGKATHLIKMLKAWKRECNVEIKSVCLEIIAGVFVSQWQHREQTMMHYDWMIRDFFAFMSIYVNGKARPAGITEWIPLGDAWDTKCQSAYNRAVKACEHEQTSKGFNASCEWQKIFGSQFQLDFAQSALAIGVSR